jgi:SAM-dependent methyltransferase
MKSLPSRQRIQEDQYAFPYHYVPQGLTRPFSQTKYWSWGFRYLGGLQVVMDLLRDVEFESLVDVGCGDGRFLRELARRNPEKRLLGVDYSSRAIGMAQALNPDLHYRVHDLTSSPISDRYDAATLVEVLEHIHPEQLPPFLENTVASVQPGGWMIVTVPHINKPVSPKHFQHFSSETLHDLLSPYCEEIELKYIDSRSRLLRLLLMTLGGQGNHFVITNHRVMAAFYRLYTKRFLYCASERSCGRIVAKCRLQADATG